MIDFIFLNVMWYLMIISVFLFESCFLVPVRCVRAYVRVCIVSAKRLSDVVYMSKMGTWADERDTAYSKLWSGLLSLRRTYAPDGLGGRGMQVKNVRK